MEIVICRFGTVPPLALEDWDFESPDARDYASQRAQRLYRALGADPSDEEYVLARHRSEDRWALFGATVEGHPFAVETYKVTVVNLATGDEQTFFCAAREAVIAAYAQSRGDFNTWDYEERYGAKVVCGRITWGLGDFAALERM